MKLEVTYLDGMNAACTITLLDAEWRSVRGTAVLKGKQKINGRLVNRSIAATEIVPNGIRQIRP